MTHSSHKSVYQSRACMSEVFAGLLGRHRARVGRLEWIAGLPECVM